MRSAHRIGRFALVTALVAAALGASAASAFASVGIEPLNTKFAGHGEGAPSWEVNSFGKFNCEQFTLAGTTNATRSSQLEATPGLAGCTALSGGAKIPVSFESSCAKKGSVPWSVSLAEGGGGSLKLNCALKLSISSCVVTIGEQTVEGGLTWTSGAKYLKLRFLPTFRSITTSGTACSVLSIHPSEIKFSGEEMIEGIHAS
jgi:hypothetical protein